MAEKTGTATCHTDGCINNGVAIAIGWDDEIDGAVPNVMCGGCMEPITDIVVT